MQKLNPWSTIACAGLMLLVALGAGLRAETGTATPGAPNDSVLAGADRPCDITIRGTNEGSSTITFDHSMSRVRTQKGWWKKLGSWIGTVRGGGGTLASSVRLDFSCSANRRYRLYFSRSNTSDVTCYYPSSTGFTTRTTLNLGDVSRYFDANRTTSSCAAP